MKKLNIFISNPKTNIKFESEFFGIVKSVKREWRRNNYKKVLLEQKNIIFEKFVPKEFLEILNTDTKDIENGQVIEIEASILFCDIRSYTNLSENLTSQQTFEFINTYLNIMSPIIKKNN